MEVILTHEQADFDAVASLYAASLLYPERTAILPRRLNRNVLSFLKEFQDIFHFKTWDKKLKETITSVLLVDTQTYSQSPLFSADLSVAVIDHHQPRKNLPESWKCRFGQNGSCTSMLAEELKKNNIVPGVIACSLMMMGIYEDTGNLSYGSTAVQDMESAGWLLSLGADLDLLRQFLNNPMTEEQNALCDLLLQHTETLKISGLEIIIAWADARENKDEFSTVAHHLRDMMGPDALFILLATKAGVRLIGRATNDQVDVNKVMKRFNGGGHSRAAAGLVLLEKDQDVMQLLEKTRNELKTLLPGFVTPALKVGQIMSRKPLLISVEKTSAEAEMLIQRYGYEGYPVIDSAGEVVGLLNSRSVERASAFKLNMSIGDIMDPGSYIVHSGDSLDYLKEIMNISGWGQIPVLSDDSLEIIGIVTRTDLIKTLSGIRGVPGSRNFANQLTNALPAGYLALIKLIADAAAACHYPIYIVGGFVRDLILSRPVMDFDMVVEGDAIHLAKVLVNMYGGKIISHAQFGTAKWMIRDVRDSILKGTASSPEVVSEKLPESLDLISARTEFYDYPTALPKVERSSIKLDLHRRDFTINTMALRLDGNHFGELLDFWGGYDDLNNKLIRVLHSLSFTDDPTRMLRAIRFEQRFNFTIENHTRLLMENGKELLKQVTGRRILHELDAFFHEECPESGLKRLDETGLLKNIHPSLFWDDSCSEKYQRLNTFHPDDFWKKEIPSHQNFILEDGKYLMWWGGYSASDQKELCIRFQMSNRIEKELEGMRLLYEKVPLAEFKWPSEISFFLDEIPIPSIYCYYCLCGKDSIRETICRYMTSWRKMAPFTKGTDLLKLNYAPGEWISSLLKRLRKAWIDEEISSEAEEKKLLANLLPEFIGATRKKIK